MLTTSAEALLGLGVGRGWTCGGFLFLRRLPSVTVSAYFPPSRLWVSGSLHATLLPSGETLAFSVISYTLFTLFMH